MLMLSNLYINSLIYFCLIRINIKLNEYKYIKVLNKLMNYKFLSNNKTILNII